MYVVRSYHEINAGFMDKSLWAKKNRINNQPMWLPLMVHLNDTMEVCGRLYDEWLSTGVKNLMAESIFPGASNKDKKLRQLCCFLGAIHDLGKATPIFQTQKSFNQDLELDSLMLEKLEGAGFKGIADYALQKKDNIRHEVSGQYFLTQFSVNFCVANIIGAHHGRPVPKKVSDDCFSFASSLYQEENPNSPAGIFWRKIQRDIFDWALTSCGISTSEDLPLILQPWQVILSGLLIMADWITSNEKYFPLISLDDANASRDRVEQGFKKWQEDRTGAWQPQPFCSEIYQQRFGFSPRDPQKRISKVIHNIHEPGIVILEAPMGMGKTEAALVAVEDLAAKTNRTGMFFGLPTQATSNGIFFRVKDWLVCAEGKKSIRLIHGKAQLNAEFSDLPKSRNIHDGDGISVNEWFAGRKVSMLDDFTVGTVDQILLAALKQKHLMLRHLGLSNKVVVIDEVHAYDAYMSVYLYRALRWLGAYKVPVVILSATLPISKRNALLESYMVGAGYRYRRAEKPPNFDNNEAYPLLTYHDGPVIRQFSDFNKELGRDYTIIRKSKEESEDLVGLIKEITPGKGVVGVIVNTVKKAQAFAEQCVETFGDDKVELLHSAFIATDRYKKEKDLIDTIGKDGKRPDFKIIIGTQVIEQSLDIDFDVMVTDLAPMDLILQRMGRLHRHENTKRPSTLQEPKVYVLNCGNYDFDKGSSYIYSDYLLFRTEYFLPDKINLPNDISHLVQLVYGDQDLCLEEAQKKAYEDYKKDNHDANQAKEKKAKGYRLDKPLINKVTEDKNLSDWIINSDKVAEASETKSYAQVRDTTDTVEVIALKACEGGYEFFDKPGLLDPEDNKTAMEIAKRTIKLPNSLYYGQKIDQSSDKSKTKNLNQAIDDVIDELEAYYLEYFIDWDRQVWLKGSLGIIFNEDNEFTLCNKILKYDQKYGIKVMQEDTNA